MMKALFIDEVFPPIIHLLDPGWRTEIANHTKIKMEMEEGLVRAVGSGCPQPAEKVIRVLSHWLAIRYDPGIAQQVHLMQLKLNVSLYNYAIERRVINSVFWKPLGVCCIGQSIAIKLSDNGKLGLLIPWQLYTLWDWSEIGDSGMILCSIGSSSPEKQFIINVSDLSKSALLFLLTDGHLWPPAFPVVRRDDVQKRILEGWSENAAVESATLQKQEMMIQTGH